MGRGDAVTAAAGGFPTDAQIALALSIGEVVPRDAAERVMGTCEAAAGGSALNEAGMQRLAAIKALFAPLACAEGHPRAETFSAWLEGAPRSAWRHASIDEVALDRQARGNYGEAMPEWAALRFGFKSGARWGFQAASAEAAEAAVPALLARANALLAVPIAEAELARAVDDGLARNPESAAEGALDAALSLMNARSPRRNGALAAPERRARGRSMDEARQFASALDLARAAIAARRPAIETGTG